MPICFEPEGVIPACLLPFTGSAEIDEAGLRRHLRTLAGIRGVTGVVVNGHASEVHACTAAEQQRINEIAVDEIGDLVPVICGIYADSTALARQLARSAENAGIHALLLFPCNALMFGGTGRPELAERYVRDVAEATGLPLIVFQFPAWSNLQYDLDGLARLCDTVGTIVAIKDLCSDPRLHERQIQLLHALDRPISVLTTHSMWLAASLSMGARGVISGAGSVIADRQVALFEAVKAGSASRVCALRDEMHLLVEAFYGAPYVNWQARMKEVLFRFDQLACASVRAPLQTIPEGDWTRMQDLFSRISFRPDTIYRQTTHGSDTESSGA